MPKSSHSFVFKVPDSELKDLLLRHLEADGCIAPNLAKHFKGFSRSGMNTMVEFAVPVEEETK